jgi:3-deoxy-D-manno-octulosonic-acid transferase
MAISVFNRFILNVYNLAWMIVLPGLLISNRLRRSWRQRLIWKEDIQPVDLWIQAASGGEAYLALEIIKKLQMSATVMITSGTDQGLSILRDGIEHLPESKNSLHIKTAYFPFDAPWLMKHVINIWQPKLLVILETELWPGLMAACNEKKIPILIINGRLSKKSLPAYLKLKTFWRQARPEKIYAISPDDACRFKHLFGNNRVETMNNIKFDRINFTPNLTTDPGPVLPIIPTDSPFIVLGSVRKEEEKDILKIIVKTLSLQPETVIGLFPRHMHRIKSWKHILNSAGVRWILRSRHDHPSRPGTVVLWDIFGELNKAYATANAVFVGGSLRPCGGQNFIEPLNYGVIPCVGPFLDNFTWVGEKIFSHKLAFRITNRHELVKTLLTHLETPRDRQKIIERAKTYVTERQGGTDQACQAIMNYMSKAP